VTKKEAIDTLKLMQAQVEWEYPMDYSVAIDMAIAALAERPDIIRCNACRHWTQTIGNMPGYGLGDCDYLNAKLVNCNGFC
jgi:hypothetical protein